MKRVQSAAQRSGGGGATVRLGKEASAEPLAPASRPSFPPHRFEPLGGIPSPLGYPEPMGRAASLASEATQQSLAGDLLFEIAHATDTLSGGGWALGRKLPLCPSPCPQTVAGQQLSGV